MRLSCSELESIYRACEALEKGNRLDYFYFVYNSDAWIKVLDFYDGVYGDWSDFSKQSNNERIMALLFYATVMQDGGL